MLLEELVLPLRTDNALFKAGLASAAAGVAALVAGMGLAIKATFKWADELDSIQDIMGVTNKTAAALNFTLRKSGTNTETLTKGMTILSKGLIKADGSLDTTGKSLKAWGINVMDANGMLKDQEQLIGDITDKYASFSTQQEKVNFLTETFGRSGAELIDFFDTLAAEGGIDSVAAKVERLGLAIDPNRYEQFNRNLEELKLVGLGLAVSFTERVMPVIEKFLGMLADPKGIDVSKIATWASDTIAKLVKGLGDSINDWASGDGPEAFSESLISWIEGIGDEDRVKSKLEIAMGHLVTSIGKALTEVDWEGVKSAIGDKIEEMFDSNRERGVNSVADFWDDLELSGTEKVRNMLNNWDQEAAKTLPKMGMRFHTWGQGIVTGPLTTFEIESTNKLRNTMNNWEQDISAKMRTIAASMYAMGLRWANQTSQGFLAGKDQILGTIRELVTLINAILKKIITSFSLNFTGFNMGSQGGASANSNLGGGGGGGASGVVKPGQIGGRASGGPVIGGQSYNVAEFFKPERFTPNVSGRVDPIQQQTVVATIDEGRLARTIVQAMMQAWNSG